VLLVARPRGLKKIEHTNNHDHDTDQDRLSSSKALTDEAGCDSADKGTNLEDGHDKSDQVCSLVAVRVDAECVGEGRTTNEASHETIVETDEEETETCQGGDGGEEGGSLELHDHVG